MDALISPAEVHALISALVLTSTVITLAWVTAALRCSRLRPAFTFLAIANAAIVVTASSVNEESGPLDSSTLFLPGIFLALLLYALSLCRLFEAPSPPGLTLLALGVLATAAVNVASAGSMGTMAVTTFLLAASVTLFVAARLKRNELTTELSTFNVKVLCAPELALAAVFYVTVFAVLFSNEVNQSFPPFLYALTTLVFTLLLNATAGIIALRSNKQNVIEQTLRDELTGLPNNQAAQQILSHLWSEHQTFARNFSLLLIDIDHFTRINARYGTEAGTRAIRGMAEILSQNLRSCDVPARLGGEEFVVMLPDTSLGTAEKVAEKLRRQFSDVQWEHSLTPVTASIGCADTKSASSADRMLTLAKGALFQAKFTGRNRVVSATLEAQTVALTTS